MADFSFLSDSDDENAVEDLLSLTKDQIVLEQVAAINCSGFTDSLLPTHLETRFQKLKSFPTSKPKSSSSLHTHSTSSSSSNLPEAKTVSKPRTESNSGSDSENNSVDENDLSPSKSFKDDIFSPSKKNPDGKIEKSPKCRLESSTFEAKTESRPITESNSGSDSVKNSVEKKGLSHSKLFQNDIFSPSKTNPDRKMTKKPKSPSGSFSSGDSSTESTSPPKKSGCFWWSPKRASRKTSKENKVLGMGVDWEKEDELLSDLNIFSANKQKMLLRKAMKLEEKINKEAEKIAKLANQASAK